MIESGHWTYTVTINGSSGEDVWGAVTGSCSQDDPRATQETALSTPPCDCRW